MSTEYILYLDALSEFMVKLFSDLFFAREIPNLEYRNSAYLDTESSVLIMRLNSDRFKFVKHVVQKDLDIFYFDSMDVKFSAPIQNVLTNEIYSEYTAHDVMQDYFSLITVLSTFEFETLYCCKKAYELSQCTSYYINVAGDFSRIKNFYTQENEDVTK